MARRWPRGVGVGIATVRYGYGRSRAESRKVRLTGHTGAVKSLTFSPDGQTLASGSDDRTIRLWSVSSQELQRAPLTGHKDEVSSVTFSPDGQTLASGSGERDQTVRLWSVASHRCLTVFAWSCAIYSVAFQLPRIRLRLLNQSPTSMDRQAVQRDQDLLSHSKIGRML